MTETGAELARAAGARSRRAFDFVGNVEGGDLLTRRADVVVTDGLTGNIALKVLEGTSQVLLRAIRDAAMTSTRAKVGGLLLKGARCGGLREEIDPEGVGGAYLLGLRRLGVVPHGRFTPRGLRPGDPARAARGARGHRRPDARRARRGRGAAALTGVRGGR